MSALRGIRVVDFGQWIAGPLAAMLLGDQGAEVVHVDPPGGPRWPTPANAIWNRGKRTVVLDLRRGADLATARRLIGEADVVVENFRPGVMTRLGLDAHEVLRDNPRLIYCSLPGFAGDDPRAAVPGLGRRARRGDGRLRTAGRPALHRAPDLVVLRRRSPPPWPS